MLHADHDNGSGGWNDTANVIDGAWNRFNTVNSPWNGPLAFGPGENSGDKPAPKVKARNLCPGPDGRTDVNFTGKRPSSISRSCSSRPSFQSTTLLPFLCCQFSCDRLLLRLLLWTPPHAGNWVRMVELAGNGNGGSCDGLYNGKQLNSSCWLNFDNWMNGQFSPRGSTVRRVTSHRRTTTRRSLRPRRR